MTKVSAVIPTWNGRDLLADMLPSVAAQDYRNLEVVVVDNGSTDGTADYLRTEWPNVRLIELSKNLGFAPAVNHGVAESDGDYIALLNNDLELKTDWMSKMVAAAEAHPEAGSIASKLLDYKNRTQIEGAGTEMSWYATPIKRGEGQPDADQFPAGWIYGVVGGAALYRRKAWDDVGPFDDEFFAYHEESDWSFRALLRGWRCWYEPAAAAFHLGGATSGRVGNWALRLTNRNIVWLVVKNYPLGELVRHFPKLVFSFAKTFWGALKGGWLLVLLRSWGGAALGLPKMIGRRLSIQRSRKRDVDLNAVIRSDFPLKSRVLGK